MESNEETHIVYPSMNDRHRPADWQMHVLIWVIYDAHVHRHTRGESAESTKGLCQSCWEDVQAACHPRIVSGATQAKYILVFDVQDCLVTRGMLGHSGRGVASARTVIIILFWDSLFSARLFMLWRSERIGLRGAQISGLSSLEALMALNSEPRMTRPRRESLTDF